MCSILSSATGYMRLVGQPSFSFCFAYPVDEVHFAVAELNLLAVLVKSDDAETGKSPEMPWCYWSLQ